MDAHTQHPNEPADAVVVGGGLAGLTAAALLARGGRRVVVLERAGGLGGRAATHVRDGAHFNLGPHALYCHGHAFRLLRSLSVPFTGRIPNPGRSYFVDGGAAHPAPVGLWSLLASRLLTLREKWRLARLAPTLRRTDARGLDRVPVSRWIADTAGRGKLASVLRALVRVSTYSDDPDRASAGAVVDQLRLGFAGNVWYLDGGWQTLIDGLRARATEHGTKVRTQATVSAVDADADGVSVRLDGGEVVRARTAILAAWPDDAVKLLRLPGHARLAQWAARRTPVKSACLDVALSRLPRPRDGFALGLDRPLYYSVHSATARLAPDGTAVIQLLKYLGTDPTGEGAESELEALLDRLQPGWQGHVVFRRFLPGMTPAHALPRADEGGLTGRPGVTQSGVPNVLLAGDWVGPRGMLADASAASAEEAALHALTTPARFGGTGIPACAVS